jgi:dipeptidyl-peptidase-4
VRAPAEEGKTGGAVTDTFPRQYARTRGFNLGLPRAFSLASDGSRVAFLRSAAGDDPLAGLWVFDPASGQEMAVFDPAKLGGSE